MEKMSSSCSKIRQTLRRWSQKVSTTVHHLPAGHVAVTVGPSCKRFVVRTTYLNHPILKKLLIQAGEESGFTNSGPLHIPCDESLFKDILRYLDRTQSAKSGPARSMSFEDFQTYCHVGFQSNHKLLADSRPLLDGFSDKSI